MRRKIALLLCMVLIFNFMPINLIHAASKLDFKELEGELVLTENGENLTLDNNVDITKQEKATLQWDISNAGKYALTYYTDTNTESGYHGTTTVEIAFTVGYEEIVYEAKAKKSDGTTIKEEKITIGRKNPGTSRYIKTYVGALQLFINVDVEGKIVQLTTNGVNKGYYTPFEMNYEGNKEYICILKGIDELKIISTHYKKDVSDINGSLSELKVTNDEGTDIPGDRPGIKVQFKIPKVVNASNQFVPIDTIDSNKVIASIALYPKLEASSKAEESTSAKFDVKLEGGNPKIEFLGSAIKQENAAGSKKATITKDANGESYATIYLAAEDDFINIKEQIVKWSTLKESMFISGDITIKGLINANTKYNNYSAADNFIFDTGVTYLKYVPTKAEEGKVVLDITPYKYRNQKLFYKIYQSNTSAIDLKKPFGTFSYTYTEANANETFPITVPGDGENRFLIRVSFSDIDDAQFFPSQEVIYDTTGIVSSPASSEIVNVEDIYVVPKEDNKKLADAVGFNVRWNVPNKDDLMSTLKKGDLYYELSISDKKDSAQDERKLLAIVQYPKNGDKPVVYAGKFKGDIPRDKLVNIEDGKTNSTITLNGLILKEISKKPQILETPVNYIEGENYPKDTAFSFKDTDDYSIPKTYYLRIRTILDSDLGKIKTDLYDSAPYAIALDTVTKPIPSPTDLNYKLEDNSLVNYELGFNNVSLDEYSYYEIEPRKEVLFSNRGIDNKDLPRTFEVYLRQNTYITTSSALFEGGLTEDDINKAGNIYEYSNVLNDENNEIPLDETILSQLRNGKIVKIKYHTKEDRNKKDSSVKFKLKNLDPNQTYNFRVRTNIDIKKADGTMISKYSLLSKTIGFTTGTQVKPPSPDEMQLPTPKDYVAIASDSATAILNWHDPEMSVDKELTYEIVRVTDTMIDTDALTKGIKQKLDQFMTSIGRTDAVKFTADRTNKVSKKNEQTGTIELIYELKDNTVSPNTIYYYYIRTVCEDSYSQWIYQPVTTKNIDKPEDLKAIASTKDSIDVSFLAKVPVGSVPTSYDFEIVIQEDSEGEWKVVSNKSKMKETRDGIKEGYTYFEYRIPDLKPNKRYNIKVCLIDKTSGDQLKSLYSNVVFTRTTFDEAEQEKEDKYDDFLDKFDKEIEKLKNKSYWVVESGVTYKYRADYFNAEMGVNKIFTLFSEQNESEAYYYLPVSSIEKSNEEQIILQVKLGDQTVAIRPNTLTGNNESIREVIDDVGTGRIEDYYIGIHVSTQRINDKINDQQPLSPKITLDLDVIYLNQEDWLVEKEILEEFTQIVEGERERFVEKLKRNVDRKYISDSELKGLIENSINDIQRLHEKRVRKVIDKHNRKQQAIDKIEKSILITITNSDNYMVDGFYYNKGQWQNVQTYSTGDSAYIEATLLGSYVFIGQASLLNTVPSLAPYQKFISQYGLTEFFTLDSYTIQTAVKKEQLYGALARVMGASQGTDYIVFLNGKSIEGVSKLTKGNLVRQDEAIYLMMQGYEKIKNKSVESIHIQNMQSVKNIGAFHPKYRPYVYVAVQLKIIDNPNAIVLPSKQISVEEFIKALYLMTQK